MRFIWILANIHLCASCLSRNCWRMENGFHFLSEWWTLYISAHICCFWIFSDIKIGESQLHPGTSYPSIYYKRDLKGSPDPHVHQRAEHRTLPCPSWPLFTLAAEWVLLWVSGALSSKAPTSQNTTSHNTSRWHFLGPHKAYLHSNTPMVSYSDYLLGALIGCQEKLLFFDSHTFLERMLLSLAWHTGIDPINICQLNPSSEQDDGRGYVDEQLIF